MPFMTGDCGFLSEKLVVWLHDLKHFFRLGYCLVSGSSLLAEAVSFLHFKRLLSMGIHKSPQLGQPLGLVNEKSKQM